jgi:hypothetical protein
VIFGVKHCGILLKTVWYFTQNTVVFFKNSVVFLDAKNSGEKTLSQGYSESTSVNRTVQSEKTGKTAS